MPLSSSISFVFCRHFDPNGSGSIHYGEFVWAFFNRRALVRQWKRVTQGLTHEQMRSKFHQFDVNGDGRLDQKEFKKMLKNLGIVIGDDEQKTLVERFDIDGDGDVDLREFFNFMESEMAALGGSEVIREGKADGSGFSSEGESKVRSSLTRSGKSSPPRSRSRPRSAAAATHSTGSTAGKRNHSADDHRHSFSEFADGQPPPPPYYDASALDQSSAHSLPNMTTRSTGNTFAATAHSPTIRRSVSSPDATDLDALWASRMLRHQANVENKLGGQYF